MLKVLEKHFEKLKKYGDLTNPRNDIPFSKIVDKIVMLKDPEAIPLLLQYFDDEMSCEYTSEVLVSRIEKFGKNYYIPILLVELKNMCFKAKEYCIDFLSRIMNSNDHIEVLKCNIHLADKDTMLKLLESMANDKYCPEEHKVIINDLRKLIDK